jgi:ABC-type phosphate transport system permease subunit
MRHRKRNAIALLVISLVLFAFEAGIWARSTIHARTETDKQNILGHQQPNEIPAIAGTFLLIAAAAVAATPLSRERRHRKI